MHFLTPSGSKSIFTPDDSKTSALPHALVIDLFPCLATFKPAPATTNAEMVEILIVLDPSPPVPQVSTAFKSSFNLTCNALLCITRAMPAISSGVSPLILSAVTKAPNCDGNDSPVIISSITLPASSSEMS